MIKASPIDLTLVLPLFNEGRILSHNLEKIRNVLRQGDFTFEMFLIDDCSSDDSAVTAGQFAARHPEESKLICHQRNLGRGATVSEGFRNGRGAVVGFIDVDCEVSPQYILDFVPELLNRKTDGITGFRVYTISAGSFVRAISSISYRFLERIFLDMPFKDSQTGYKFFLKEKIVPLLENVSSPGWFWDTEIMAVASVAGLRVEEWPVIFFRNPEKKSTVRLLRDSLRTFWQLVRYRKTIQMHRRKLLNQARTAHERSEYKDAVEN